jgi:NhaA family Na+:H+ antiporter
VLVIAAFYSGGVAWGALGLAGALLAAAFAANAPACAARGPYALLGVPLWGRVLASGIHATVGRRAARLRHPGAHARGRARVPRRARRSLDDFDAALGPAGARAEPPRARVLTNAASQEALHCLEELTEAAQPPLHRMEHALHGVVAFGVMPLFALANAGVTLAGGRPARGWGRVRGAAQALGTPGGARRTALGLWSASRSASRSARGSPCGSAWPSGPPT